MNILFIHQNFPGQFIYLAEDLAQDSDNTVVALSMHDHPVPNGVISRRYSLLRPLANETHYLLKEQETHLLRAEACAAAALQLKNEGFVPDLIIAHPGWGEALFIKDVFQQAKLALYCEFYYAAEGLDVGFDPEEPSLTFAQRCRLRLKNTVNLLSMECADLAFSPTQWQKSTYPQWAQDKIEVIHEGVDFQKLKFNPNASLTVQTNGNRTAHQFHPGDEVISYVSRNLEPVRGFPTFMRSLPEILRRCPNAHAVIVGGNDVSYGTASRDGKSWKEVMLAEVGDSLDLKRVHFLGQVSYITYLQLLNISRVHAYWTIPFVLSWSFLEAAASGLPIVASATPPVLEFSDQFHVKTVDFFNTNRFSDLLTAQLQRPPEFPRTSFYSPALDIRHCVSKQKQYLMSQCK